MNKSNPCANYTDITDSNQLIEIEKILDHLDSDDRVLIVAKQAKFRPGGALTSPNTFFATNKKIIIRNPSMLGMRESVEEINYNSLPTRPGAPPSWNGI